MVYGIRGKSYQNLNNKDKAILKTYDESLDFLESNLIDLYDKVKIIFKFENKKQESYSIYFYGGKWLRIEQVKEKLKRYFKGE